MLFSARFRFAVMAVLAGQFAGCTSLKSTMLTRDESNSCWQKVKSHGVPITLSVPTHLKIQIQERRYLTPEIVGGDPKYDTWVPMTDCGQPIVTLDVKHDFIRTEKIFTVDFKRPAAGTIDFKADFNNQYITSLSSNITDRTIADVSLALQGILSVVPKRGPGAPQAMMADGTRNINFPAIKEINSVRAIGIFELDDPNWELKLAQFIESHICGASGGPIHPPLDDLKNVIEYNEAGEPMSIPTGPIPPAPGASFQRKTSDTDIRQSHYASAEKH